MERLNALRLGAEAVLDLDFMLLMFIFMFLLARRLRINANAPFSPGKVRRCVEVSGVLLQPSWSHHLHPPAVRRNYDKEGEMFPTCARN